MPRVAKTTVAALLVLAGSGASVFCLLQIIQGQWLWTVLFIAAGAIAASGLRIFFGEKLKNVIEDLLFVLLNTH